MKSIIPSPRLKPPTEPRVWAACFLSFSAANFILSYSRLPVLWKMETAFFFLVLPGVFLLWWNFRAKPLRETAFSIPPWLWACLIGAALIPRLWRLTSLSVWPVADEGMNGYFATRLEEGWNWRLVHAPFNISAVYTWILYVFFRLFHNSLASLWLPPALLGWGCLFFFPSLNRKIVPAPIAFYGACWMAFGFWPLYLGRFSHQAVFFVFWECLVLAILSKCLDASSEVPSFKGKWIALALLTGLGFYTYLAWPMAAFVVFATLAVKPLRPWNRKLAFLAQFGLVALLPAVPLFISLGRNYHHYLEHLWAFGTPGNLWQRLQLPAAYFQNLFWGADTPGFFSYGSLWGGLLNPVQTSLFLLGAASLFRPPFKIPRLWLLGALAACFIPAFLTNNLEMMRLTGLIPLLAYGSALGTRRLLAFLPPAKAWVAFLLLLGVSFLLDSHHLFQVYPGIPKTFPHHYGMHKSPEYEKAFAVLEPLAQKEGPGLLLLNGIPDPFDQTLSVATYSFNALGNRRLDPKTAAWAAILVNVHERPFLSNAFPGTEFIWLSKGLQRRDGGLLLAVIPLTDDTRERIQSWSRADRSLQELTDSVMELGVAPDQSPMLGILEKAYPLFKGDRLLESRFWRLWALHEAAAGREGEAIAGEKKAIVRGYPMAHLYNELGCLLFQEGRLAESKKAFEEAIRLTPNDTDAASNLQNLSALKNQ